jgi:hypothetical protein
MSKGGHTNRSKEGHNNRGTSEQSATLENKRVRVCKEK